MVRYQKYDIERGFICELLHSGDMLAVQDNQIKPGFFSGDHASVFRFISEYYTQHSQVPSPRVVKSYFAHYVFEYVSDGVVGTAEPLSHWCAELRTKVKREHIDALVDAVLQSFEETRDPDCALADLTKGISYIQTDIDIVRDVDITVDADMRIETYNNKKLTQGMSEIAYGIPTLDNYTKGLAKGTLTTLIAKTSVGKTFFQVMVGAYAMLNNHKVLHCITEMSEEIMRDRYDAMLYSMANDGGFSYSKFKSAALDADEEAKYFKFLREVLPTFEPLILYPATDVPSILAKAAAIKADLIMVDGAYLMEDARGSNSDWLRVAHITRDLKIGAKRLDVPIFINSQADKSTSKLGPEMDNISYAQSIGQDSDVVLALYRDEIMRNDDEIGVKILKQREGMTGTVVMTWDFKTMTFEEIFAKGEKGTGDGDDSVQEDDQVRENIVAKGAKV